MAETFSYDEVAGPDLEGLEVEHGLPKGLLKAIQTAEGSGDKAVSPKGARGRFQFMPDTAKKFGLDDPDDPVKSAAAAARYMKYAMEQYGTSDPKVLAAEYNGGPRQAKAVLEGRAPPAAETQKYIAKVAGLLGVGDATAAPAKAVESFSYEDIAGVPALLKAPPAKKAAPSPRQISPLMIGPVAIDKAGPAAEVVVNMATGFGANAMGQIAALLRASGGVTDNAPVNFAGVELPGRTDPTTIRNEITDALTYKPRGEDAKKFVEEGPLTKIVEKVKKATDWVGNKAFDPQGPYNPLGAGLSETLLQSIGLGGGLAAKGIGAAAQGAKPFVGSRWWMQSALKPQKAELLSGAGDRAITTMFDEGVNATRGGAETLRGRVDVLNDKIKTLIQNSPAVIDKSAVQGRLLDTYGRFIDQVNPMTDIKLIQKAWDEFETTWPQQISVQQAQKMKQGTYRELAGKYQGEKETASVAAEKDLARGLKEEIAKVVPEVVPLNAAESKLLNTLPMIERRALMDANKNPVGFGFLTTDPVKFALWMADKSALAKSLVARMLRNSGVALEGIAPAGVAPGFVVNQPEK